MSKIIAIEKKSPFKFLDPYTKEERNIFFGRDEEIKNLYEMVFESKLILVYGQSGTGKTSLIRCGLANEFKSTDWFDIFVRREENINASLKRSLEENARTPFKKGATVEEMVKSLFLDYFQPIYLLFDQFEELFAYDSMSQEEVDATEKEKNAFIQTISALVNSKLSCKIILIMREEIFGPLI